MWHSGVWPDESVWNATMRLSWFTLVKESDLICFSGRGQTEDWDLMQTLGAGNRKLSWQRTTTSVWQLNDTLPRTRAATCFTAVCLWEQVLWEQVSWLAGTKGRCVKVNAGGGSRSAPPTHTSRGGDKRTTSWEGTIFVFNVLKVDNWPFVR